MSGYFLQSRKTELEQSYVELECLGKGGFGSVFSGFRRLDHLPVAIKHVPANSVKRTTVKMDGELKELPLEVVLLALASDGADGAGETHRFSIQMLDWYDLQDELVLVMERPVPSVDLFDHVQNSGGRLKEDEAKEILRQLVEGIIKVLSKGVLHCDLKPENILVHKDPKRLQIRILDFGCGSVLPQASDISVYGLTWCGPAEQGLQTPQQIMSSITWQVGVVLYFLLNGERPFKNTNEMIFKDPYIRGDLSQECKDLLRSCLKKLPRSRPSLPEILLHPWLSLT